MILLKRIIKNRLHHYVNGNGQQTDGANSNLWGDCSNLRGDCSSLSGDCTGLSGDCSGLSGNCTDKTRAKLTTIDTLVEEDK